MIQEFHAKNLKETVESNDDIYQILNHRMTYYSKNTTTISLNKSLSQTNDNKKKYMDILTIPDLCYLVKETQSKNILNMLSKNKKITKTGLYHYVYGLNTSNVAFISAYVLKFIQKNHKQTNYRIIQSVFSVFDFFLEKDLRILIKFPGGVKKYFYIDDTEATEAQSEGLRTAFLSSILRIWYFNQNNVSTNVLLLEEINNVQTFDYLCESIEWLISTQIKLHLFDQQKVNLMLRYFNKYLITTRRYNYIITFFNKLLHFDLNFAQFAIKPLKILGLYQDTISYLATLCVNPNIEDVQDNTNSYRCNYNIDNNSKQNPKLLWLEIEVLMKLKEYDDALKIAKYVTSMTPKNIEAWLILAELYLRMNQHEKFFRALNNIFIMDSSNNNNNLKFLNEEENYSFGLNNCLTLIDSIKKNFSINEIPISFNNQKNFNINSNNIFNPDNKHNKKLIDLLCLKINDLFSKPKNCVDVYYTSNKYDQLNVFNDLHDESEDFFQHMTIKILNSNYINFSHIQKKIYSLLLQLVKDINFDSFITLKRKIFSTNSNNINENINQNSTNNENNPSNINGVLIGAENSSLNSNFNQIQSYSLVNEMKLQMHQNLEIVVDTLIEDLKIFSVVINTNISGGGAGSEFGYQASDMENIQGIEEGQNTNTYGKNGNIIINENTLNSIRNKDELSVKEIKFCISFASLSERLGYKNTATSLYNKAQENCFSKFLLIRKISIYLKDNNFKQAIITLGYLLSHISEEEFKYVNKTPLWIDKIILKTLYEYQASDIMEWLDNCEEYVLDYIKKIINKYKYWIEVGHEIHLVK